MKTLHRVKKLTCPKLGLVLIAACNLSTSPNNGGGGGGSGGSGSGGGGTGGNNTCAPAATSTCAPAQVTASPVTLFKNVAEVSALAAGDVNGDGKDDVVMAWGGTGAGISVLLNKGDGTFGTPIAVPEEVQGYDIVVADFTGDCNADILVPGYQDGSPTVDLLVSNGDGTFQAPVQLPTQDENVLSLVAADFNRDGKLDFAEFNLSAESGAGVQVSLGTSTGFSPPTTFDAGDEQSYPTETRGLAAADLDGDGASELLLASPSKGACVLKNDGHGQFEGAPICYAATLNYSGDTIAAGDVNGDGKPDIVLGNGESVTSDNGSVIDVFLNKGDGTFGAPVAVPFPGAFYGAVALVDTNNDKKLDLVVYYAGAPSDPDAGFWVYLNDGTGTFPATPTAAYALAGGDAQPAYGDFLGNGLVGMVASSAGSDINDDLDVVTSSCAP